MALQPEQKDEIYRVVELFERDWMLSFKPLQIRRKPRNILQKARDLFAPRRHTVFGMYWWLKHKFHKPEPEQLIGYRFPIVHDNMPLPGYPIKYELIGGWHIPKKDLRFLVNGPLARVSPAQVLVPHQIGFERVKSFAKTWAPLATLFVALLTGVLRVLQIQLFF